MVLRTVCSSSADVTFEVVLSSGAFACDPALTPSNQPTITNATARPSTAPAPLPRSFDHPGPVPAPHGVADLSSDGDLIADGDLGPNSLADGLHIAVGRADDHADGVGVHVQRRVAQRHRQRRASAGDVCRPGRGGAAILSPSDLAPMGSNPL